MKKLVIIIVIIGFYNTIFAQKVFENLDSLLSYVASQSYTIKSGEIKFNQAKWAKYAAIIGVLDLTHSNSFMFTYN